MTVDGPGLIPMLRLMRFNDGHALVRCRRLRGRDAVLVAVQAMLLAALQPANAAEADAPAPVAPAMVQQSVGVVGSYRIGLSLVRHGSVVAGGHYFYAAHLVDIPLTGGCDDGVLALSEPGGGEFRLHLTGAGTAGGCSRWTAATGWAGTWTSGTRSLPVALRFDWMAPAMPGRRFYDGVTTEDDAVFEARVRHFVDAVLAGDKRTAAAFVSFPLRVTHGGARSDLIASRPELLADWPRVFTPGVLDALRTAIPHEMLRRNGLVMVANGTVWFGNKGACAVNVIGPVEAGSSDP